MDTQESSPINDSEVTIIDVSEEDEKLKAIEENLIQEENSDNLEHKQEINKCFSNKIVSSCLDFLLRWVNDYLNTKYLDTVFTILFGTFSMILCIVLASDSKPEMIPFEIVPINLGQKEKLARQLSIFFTFISFHSFCVFG